MRYTLALDQGTTSSRAILFDEAVRPVATAQREFPQYFPRPGWVEHDPEEIWASQLTTAREVLDRAGVPARDVAAVGITNQRETTLLWERASGLPVHRAIVWQDRRTADVTTRWKADGLEPEVRRRTGLVLDPYFSASKISWLLEGDPALRRRAEAGELCFGTVDSWLLWKLTAGRAHATDATNASRTLLFDLGALDWEEDLLERFGIPREILPRVGPSAGFFAETDPSLLGAPVPVTGIAGDQQAALFGQACLSPGMAKNTYGTGSFVVMNTGSERFLGDGVLTTLAWHLEGRAPEYALEGSIFVAGAAVQWLRDGLGLIASSADVEALAASVPDTGGVYFVPAFVGLGAPHWDPFARGLIVGLTRGTGRGHLARAALEAMAFQTRDALAAMEAASGIPVRDLRADGGASANALLLQLQADTLGAPVLRPRITETTALGAAYLAAVGAGLLKPEAIPDLWALDSRFEPQPDAPARDRAYAGWLRAVERARNWDA